MGTGMMTFALDKLPNNCLKHFLDTHKITHSNSLLEKRVLFGNLAMW